jgi:hypothetical protein
MWPRAITIATLGCGGEPLPSISVAFVSTVVCAAAFPPHIAAAIKPSQSHARIVTLSLRLLFDRIALRYDDPNAAVVAICHIGMEAREGGGGHPSARGIGTGTSAPA